MLTSMAIVPSGKGGHHTIVRLNVKPMLNMLK
jgi:hypothetical protein